MASTEAVYSYDSIGRLSEVTFSDGSSILYNYDSVGNRTSVVQIPYVPVPKSVANGFRLSASSSAPVTTSDTSASSISLVPYKSNQIALYYEGAWSIYNSSAISQSLSTSAGTVYDVFASYNGSSVVLSLVAWSSSTARATALGYQDGTLVLSTDSTKRYLGTIYCASANTVNDKAAQRHIWNYYNRVVRQLHCQDTTASWTYSSATIRAANANTTDGTGRFSFVIGVEEDAIHASSMQCKPLASGTPYLVNAIGLDSTTAVSIGGGYSASALNTDNATGSLLVSAGYHFLQRLEAVVDASGSVTIYGYSSSSNKLSSGYMNGELRM